MKNIRIDGITTGHVQGIATDGTYMYYSFTTCLIKTDMEGNILAGAKGLAGHLGCIAFHDGKVYGSLEYKHDSIGQGILQNSDIDVEDGFYIAVFDVDKLTEMDMDAEKDGVMKAVFLKEVTDDYNEKRYSASGIDGTTFAPAPGEKDGKMFLYVAYGIYGDTARQDNDHQVILRYDISDWDAYLKPLNQLSMHRNGPEKPDGKYFVYTGNTNWGIQNLEYDKATGYLFAAVYPGDKDAFPNYPMFVIDRNREAKKSDLTGLSEEGWTLSLANIGETDEKTGISGIRFPYGSTGMISFGNGNFCFSRDFYENGAWGTDIGMYRFDGNTFCECEE